MAISESLVNRVPVTRNASTITATKRKIGSHRVSIIRKSVTLTDMYAGRGQQHPSCVEEVCP